MPYKSAEEIENTIAALLVAKFQSDFRAELLDNALAHARQARSGNSK